MHHFLIGLALALVVSVSTAQAHVRVLPAESQPGAKQVYTVRVPTEGKVATTAVVLDVPEGVSVISAQGQPEVARLGGRITSITWKAEIPPGQSHVFTFEATNPASGQLVWKAHQRYADGSTRDWAHEPTSKSPASVTRLNGPPN